MDIWVKIYSKLLRYLIRKIRKENLTDSNEKENL